MPLVLANNAASRLSSSLAAAATTLSVTPGDGVKFPAPSAGDWFPLTLVKSDGTLEIVHCTARSTDTLTITRAREGTTALAFSAGDRVELRLTKAAVDSKVDVISGKQLSTNDYTTAEKNKLAGIATGATANSTDAALRSRSTHTGTQSVSTITGLGTAATANIQTSLNDATAGSLMTTGAFGLGGDELNWPSTTFNYTTAPTGFYRASNTVTNAPETGEFWGVLVEKAPDGGFIKQTVWGLNNKRSYFRIISSNVAGPWVQIITSLECSFSIVAPAVTNVAPNTRYVLDNPFGNSQVICIAEISVSGTWWETGWAYANGGYGVKASQIGSAIVIQTGSVALAAGSADSGNPSGLVSPVTSAPCRVKVWKVNS